MRCRQCSEVRGYPYKRSHLVALRATIITASDPPSSWWPGGAVNVKEAGMERAKKALPLLAILFLAMLSSGERFGHVAKAQSIAQSIASVLAAQIRSQGIVCDQKATRDAKLSKPDYDVWVLTCKNATYRIGRYPDLAAKVEKLK